MRGSQTRNVLLDPYANAFYKNATKVSEWKSDLTDMKPGDHFVAFFNGQPTDTIQTLVGAPALDRRLAANLGELAARPMILDVGGGTGLRPALWPLAAACRGGGRL